MGATARAIETFLADFPGSMGPLQIREHRREKFMAIGTTLN